MLPKTRAKIGLIPGNFPKKLRTEDSREFSGNFYITVEPNSGENSEKFEIFLIFLFMRISDFILSKPHRSVQNDRKLSNRKAFTLKN